MDGQGSEGTMVSLAIEETLAVLTRCSFEENHRQPILNLGGVPALAELVQVSFYGLNYQLQTGKLTPSLSSEQVERALHGELSPESVQKDEKTPSSEVRRLACVAFTNLTFGNASIKKYLCHFDGFVPVMVQQLRSPFLNVRKNTAHVFRNLAWKADKSSKTVLSESGVVTVLMALAMEATKRINGDPEEEAALKVILSALWNLSAHCGKNKVSLFIPS